jgi:hypothetical protein
MAGNVPRGSSRQLPPDPRPGWPKTLPCLVCDRPRLAQHPGDRLHERCAAVEPGGVSIGGFATPSRIRAVRGD